MGYEHVSQAKTDVQKNKEKQSCMVMMPEKIALIC